MTIVVRSLWTGSRVQSAMTKLAHDRLPMTSHKQPALLSMDLQREIVFLLSQRAVWTTKLLPTSSGTALVGG